MLFSPTIGAAVTAGYWFLWVRCLACRTINVIDLRTLDRHRDAAVTSLIPALSCRSSGIVSDQPVFMKSLYLCHPFPLEFLCTQAPNIACEWAGVFALS
jgi:hypothetical protein